MKLKKLSIADRKIFQRYLNISCRELSVYAFANIYIWKGLFEVNWTIDKDCLCVFFRDKMGIFLYLPPLGVRITEETIVKVFALMNDLNPNPEVSRIENLEKKDLDLYHRLGYKSFPKSSDYICLRTDLVRLKGNAFKSKRASRNYFCKHYAYKFKPFVKNDDAACRDLFGLWAKQRLPKSDDPVYQGLIDDSQNAFGIMLDRYERLDCIGRVVEVSGRIKGFTFGYPINADTFCILYEITDLSIKGLAQFIFQAFCSELKGYKYINVMDDSGLENLKQVKLSYHPVKLIPAYIVKK